MMLLKTQPVMKTIPPNPKHKIGIDVGGVLTFSHKQYNNDLQQAPHAVNVVKMIIQHYGPNNVFIVSKAGHNRSEQIENGFNSTFLNSTCQISISVVTERVQREKSLF